MALHSGGDGSALGGEAYRQLSVGLEAVFSEGVYDHATLHGDVCNYVRELKSGGASAQSVIISARKLVRDLAARFPPSNRTESLLTQMLGWCVDEYYKESA